MWTSLFFKDAADWNAFVGKLDAGKTVLSGKPERFPCLMKYRIVQDVYEMMTPCFFYADEAQAMVDQAWWAFPPGDSRTA